MLADRMDSKPMEDVNMPWRHTLLYHHAQLCPQTEFV